MKKITTLLFATIVTLNVSGQSFGLKGGPAITNFIGADVENSDANTGFYLGAFMKLGEGNIEWMPEILFHQKGAKSDGGNVLQVMNYIDIGVNGLFHINDELALAIGPYVGYLASGKNNNGGSITDWNIINRIEFGSNLGATYNVNDLLHFDLRYGFAFTDIFEKESKRNSSIQIGVGYVFGY